MLNSSNITSESGAEEGNLTVAEKYVNTVFLIIVMITAVSGNTIALHAFFVSSELKRITYYFIASLCISDLMIASCSIPLWLCYGVFMIEGFPIELTTFSRVLDILCSTFSIMSLAMISIERYLCIKYSLRYYTIMTTRRAIYMIIVVLVYSFIAGSINYVIMKNLLTVFSTEWVILQFTIIFMSFFLPVLIKAFSYGNIYLVASKQSKALAEHKKISKHFAIENNSNSKDKNGDLYIEDQEELDETSSGDGRSSHSGSKASWPVSPLARKRQCTQERIHILDEDDEEEDLKFKKQKRNIRLKNLFNKGFCFSKSKSKFDINENGVEKPGNYSFLQRQDTDNSIKSKKSNAASNMAIIKEELHHLTDIYIEKEDEEALSSHSKISHSLDEKSQFDSTFIHDKQRAFTLPVNVTPTTQHTLNNKGVSSIEAIKKSPLMKRFRAASIKWSPTHSPLLNRKSTRKAAESKRREQKIRKFKKDLRAAKVVGLIMGTFLLCWTPFILLNLLYTIHIPITAKPIHITKDLHYLNSAINPFLYVFLNKVYRQAVLKIFRQIKKHLPCIN